MARDFLLRPATRRDSQEIRSLLESCSLPRLDLDRSRPDFVVLENLERHARSLGVTEMVLLTETARPFFELRSYQIADRASVPTGVQQSEEFRSICPQSAACMTKKL